MSKIPKSVHQVHCYPFRLVLNPRGGQLTKESLGEVILERMMSAYDEWSDEQYGDNPDQKKLVDQICFNAEEEFQKALVEYQRRIVLRQTVKRDPPPGYNPKDL